MDFWSVTAGTSLGNFATIGLLATAIVGYTLDRRIERRERVEGQLRYHKEAEENIRKQEHMHTENRERLDGLREWRESQEHINQRRDEQISILSNLSATSAEALKGFSRRLEMMESENLRRKD